MLQPSESKLKTRIFFSNFRQFITGSLNRARMEGYTFDCLHRCNRHPLIRATVADVQVFAHLNVLEIGAAGGTPTLDSPISNRELYALSYRRCSSQPPGGSRHRAVVFHVLSNIFHCVGFPATESISTNSSIERGGCISPSNRSIFERY